MTRHPLNYADVQDAVRSGFYVVFAAGRRDGEPALVYLAARLDRRARAVAHDPRHEIRAAQAIGVVTELRRAAQREGFTPT